MQQTLNSKPLLYSLIMLCILPGCSGGCGQKAHIDRLSKKPWIPKYAMWPEFQVLAEGDNNDMETPTLRRMAKLNSMKDAEDEEMRKSPRTYCNVVNNSKFQENLKKFADTPVPAEFKTDERETSKKALIEAIADLKDSCGKKLAQKALDEKAEKIIKLWNDIYIIPGQKKPEGAEGERYAADK